MNYEIGWFDSLQAVDFIRTAAESCDIILTSTSFEFLMLNKSLYFARMMGCCNCFGFTSKPKQVLTPTYVYTNRISEQLLGVGDMEEGDYSYNGDAASSCPGDETELQFPAKRSEEILEFRAQNGLMCRQYLVKETLKVVRSEVCFIVKRTFMSKNI